MSKKKKKVQLRVVKGGMSEDRNRPYPERLYVKQDPYRSDLYCLEHFSSSYATLVSEAKADTVTYVRADSIPASQQELLEQLQTMKTRYDEQKVMIDDVYKEYVYYLSTFNRMRRYIASLYENRIIFSCVPVLCLVLALLVVFDGHFPESVNTIESYVILGVSIFVPFVLNVIVCCYNIYKWSKKI